MRRIKSFGVSLGIVSKSLLFLSLSGQVFGADITGQGFLKTQSGDIKTCAGNEVYLEPFKDEKNWTYQYVLSNKVSEAAFQNFSIETAKSMAKYDRRYYKESQKKLVEAVKPIDGFSILDRSLVQKTQCDAGGNFEFADLKQGKYIIATKVEWKVEDWEGGYQGGYISKIIDINQKKQKIILAE